MRFPWSKRREGNDYWSQPRLTDEQWRETYYGDHHQAERQKYAETLRDHGGQCMERICIADSRRIEPGAGWQLAHDHERGPRDYLGPAHPECNEFEAHMRRVSWSGDRLLDNADVDRIARSLGLDPPPLPTGEYEARMSGQRYEHAYDGGLYLVFTYTVSTGTEVGRTVEEWLKLGKDPLDSDYNPIPIGADASRAVTMTPTTAAAEQEVVEQRLALAGHLDPRHTDETRALDPNPRLLLMLANDVTGGTELNGYRKIDVTVT